MLNKKIEQRQEKINQLTIQIKELQKEKRKHYNYIQVALHRERKKKKV